jgi:hypothetical protein
VSLSVHRKYNFIILLKMKKQILNIGKALSRSEQKEVFGGNEIAYIGSDEGGGGFWDESGQCSTDSQCPDSTFMGVTKKGYCKSVACDGDPRKYCDVK